MSTAATIAAVAGQVFAEAMQLAFEHSAAAAEVALREALALLRARRAALAAIEAAEDAHVEARRAAESLNSTGPIERPDIYEEPET